MAGAILYHRPRIDKLLQNGLGYSLTLITAGQGYGKTVALNCFFETQKDAARLNLTRLDNTPHRFWHGFLDAFQTIYPECHKKLSTFGFPATSAQLDIVLQAIEAGIPKRARATLILDDYSNIKNPSILSFIDSLVQANLPGLSIIVASSSPCALGGVCIKGGGDVYLIAESQLRFTLEETAGLFSRMGYHLSRESAKEICAFADGWPLALLLILQQTQAGLITSDQYQKANLTPLYRMFAREHYDNWSEATQQLLIRLSLLDHFTANLAFQLSDGNTDGQVEAVLRSLFVHFDPSSHLYSFQRLYLEFLCTRQYTLTPQKKLETCSRAGDSFMETGHHMEAIGCYFNCGQYQDMLKAVTSLPFLRMSLDFSNRLLHYLNRLPADFTASQPLARFLRAALYLNCLETDKAISLLEDLIADLQYTNDEPSSLLGETYALLGSARLMKNESCFPGYYHTARKLLPGGSRFSFENNIVLGHSSILSLSACTSGNLRYMEMLYHQAAPDMCHIFNGGQGMEWLFSAEAAYHTYNFPLAEQNAYRAVLHAREHGQYDIVCNAHSLLARMGVMLGKYEDFMENLSAIEKCTTENPNPRLLEIRDCITAWFAIEMGCPALVPRWILDSVHRYGDRPMIDYERILLIYASYLLACGKDKEAAALLEQLHSMCRACGLWLDLLRSYIMSAMVYNRLGEKKKALEHLAKAYDMSYQNNITTPFAEFGGHIRGLVDMAQQSTVYPFDHDWCEYIRAKASTYAKRLAYVQKSFYSSHSTHTASPELTEREREILSSLAQGLTQKELSDFYGISINTVKSHIRNIYSKLGAINRADAIHIAAMYRLLA